MRLFFMRHAQSVNNALAAQNGLFQDRSEDPELTDLGYRQAEKLAQFLKSGNPFGGSYQNESPESGFDLTHLYTSLMIRSVATGAIIAEQIEAPLIAWEDIHERGGIFIEDGTTGELVGRPGKDRIYFEKHFPQLDLPAELGQTGWWNGRPFEADEQVPERARDFLEELLFKHGGSSDRVGIISHGGFYNDFLRVLIGLPPDTEIWFEMFNAAITRIDFADEAARIIYHNRMDYLPPELVS